jgi:hypothetical protein
MLKDLARGMTEVVSEAVQLDNTAIAILAENGVGGLESGMTIKFLAAVDRVFTASRAAVLFAVSPTAEFSIDEISIEQAKAICAEIKLPLNNAEFATIGWVTIETSD